MIPAVVFLPIKPRIDNRELTRALGYPSRQLLYTWRLRQRFPGPVERRGDLRLTETSAVAAWLAERNHTVKWI